MSSAPVADPAERDALINEAAEEFPEYSWADKEQERIDEEARERGPAMSYPEFEGPGYTEPAVNGPENHVDHTEEERDHYWDQDGNPSNDRDPDAGQYEHGPLVWPADRAGYGERGDVAQAEPDGYDPQDDTWSYDDRTPAERDRDQQAGEAVAARHEAEARDAEQFAQYYGEPPTPAAEREARVMDQEERAPVIDLAFKVGRDPELDDTRLAYVNASCGHARGEVPAEVVDAAREHRQEMLGRAYEREAGE